MSDLDELAVTMEEIGTGPWELELDSGETIPVDLDEIEVTEERGFHAEGRNEERELEFELSTGVQPGGAIHLKQRSFYEDEWDERGEVVAADKRDHV